MGPNAFDDDDGSVHESSINSLAAAGMVGEAGPGQYRPQAPVTRGQLATLIRGALEQRSGAPVVPAEEDLFVDDDSSVHESSINAQQRPTSADRG